MRITRIRLHNFCQHRDVDMRIDGSVVGILGANGTGKSNFMQGAADIITGEFHKPKRKIITRGEKEGWGEVEFVGNDGHAYRIHRDLKGNDAWLERIVSPGGGDVQEVVDRTAKTAAEVNDQVFGFVGADPQTLRRVVFVRQKEIDTLLFEKPAAKQKMVQNFFDVDDAEVIHKAIGAYAESIPAVDETLPGQLETIDAQIAGHVESQTNLNAAIASTVPPFAETAIPQMRGQLEAAVVANQQASRRAELLVEVASLEPQIASNQAALEAQRSMMSGWTREQIANMLALETQHEQVVARKGPLEKSIADTQAQLSELESQAAAKAAEVEGLRQAEQAAKGAFDANHAEVAAQRALRSKMDGGIPAKCPECSHEFDAAVGGAQMIEAKLDELSGPAQQLSADYQQASRALNDAIVAANDLNARKSAAASTLKSYWDQLGQLPVDPPEPAEGGWKGAAVYQRALNTFDDAAREAQRLEIILGAQTEQLATARANLGATPEAQAVDVGALRNQLTAMESQWSAYTSQLESSQRDLASVNGRLEQMHVSRAEIVARMEAQAGSVEKHAFLADLRALFHHGAAPKRFVSLKVMEIAGRINDYLKIFNAEFTAQVTDGLSFSCHFPARGGEPEKVVDADELSCGQQITLALSFRFAACETFCSSARLLVLDEPTVWLDEARRTEACVEVFERLKTMGDTHGMQFFVITHDLHLLPSFDQVIRFDDGIQNLQGGGQEGQ